MVYLAGLLNAPNTNTRLPKRFGCCVDLHWILRLKAIPPVIHLSFESNHVWVTQCWEVHVRARYVPAEASQCVANCLQQRRFATAIYADDDVEARLEIDVQAGMALVVREMNRVESPSFESPSDFRAAIFSATGR